MTNWSDYFVAVFLLVLLASLANPGIQKKITKIFSQKPWLVYAAPLCLSLVNCWHNQINGAGIFAGWKFILYLFAPTVLFYLTVKCSPTRQRIGDFLAVLIFWLPIDLRYLKDSWPNGLWYPFSSAPAIILAVVLFVCYRQLEGVNYNCLLRKQDIGLIGGQLVCLIIILLPIGLTTGFLSWNPNTKVLITFPLVFIPIFLTTALAEEFLFRGLIQNLLNRALSNQNAVLVLSAIIFGIGHLNNTVGRFSPPNFLYMLMASIAGIFYGLAYQRSKSLLVPAALHAMVDTIWGALFLAKQAAQ